MRRPAHTWTGFANLLCLLLVLSQRNAGDTERVYAGTAARARSYTGFTGPDSLGGMAGPDHVLDLPVAVAVGDRGVDDVARAASQLERSQGARPLLVVAD